MSQPDKSYLADRKSSLSLAAKAHLRLKRVCAIPATVFALLCFVLSPNVRADTIWGTVKDPSGAVVAGARVEITGGNLTQPVVLVSDESGKFVAPGLSPGKYSVRVAKDSFDSLVTMVDLKGAVDLPLSLTITAQQSSVTVTERNMAFANSDSAYRQLRDGGLGDSYRCENFTLRLDVGTFELKSGTLTLMGVVDKSVTGAIFVGQGHFTLKPVLEPDMHELIRRTGSPTAEEDLTEVDAQFAMLVPIFADFGSGMSRMGQIEVVGNSTRTVDLILDRQPKKVALNAYKDVLER